jgi:hypothetical protein
MSILQSLLAWLPLGHRPELEELEESLRIPEQSVPILLKPSRPSNFRDSKPAKRYVAAQVQAGTSQFATRTICVGGDSRPTPPWLSSRRAQPEPEPAPIETSPVEPPSIQTPPPAETPPSPSESQTEASSPAKPSIFSAPRFAPFTMPKVPSGAFARPAVSLPAGEAAAKPNPFAAGVPLATPPASLAGRFGASQGPDSAQSKTVPTQPPTFSQKPGGVRNLILAGVQNSGAHCYAISLLQVLGHIPAFVDVVELYYPDSPLRTCLDRIAHPKAALIEARLVDRVIEEIVDAGHHFDTEGEQDTHELFGLLGNRYNKYDDAIWELFTYKTRDFSPDGEPIRGEDTGTCLDTEFQPSDSLLVPFAQAETSDESGNTVLSQTKILHAPSVLVYHFKRFTFEPGDPPQAYKINDFLDIAEQVDLTAFLSEAGSEAKYRLFAIIEHIGNSMGIGHYKALINVAMGDRWWLFNDSQVTRASHDDVANMMKRAYLAFYARIDMIRQLFQ